jgi:hypothetical protein
MSWKIKILISFALVLGASWIFRAEIALFGINRMMAMQLEIGPPQDVTWSTGTADASAKSLEATTKHRADSGGRSWVERHFHERS